MVITRANSFYAETSPRVTLGDVRRAFSTRENPAQFGVPLAAQLQHCRGVAITSSKVLPT